MAEQTATRRQVMARIKALGAKFCEGHGGWYEFNVEAPVGMVWSESGDIHEQVNAIGYGFEKSPKFWGEVLHRMSHGVEPCATPDCEWCADTRSGNIA